MTRLKTVTLVVALAAGCTPADPTTTEPSPDASAKVPIASCADPDGTIRQVTAAADVNMLVLGHWEHCSGKRLLDAGEDGFEIAADGTYYVLVRNGAELQRKPGFTGQGTWNTHQEQAAVGLYFHPTPNSGNGGYPVFSEGPRKMSLLLRYQTEPTIYVWLGN
jgi:hypothetical protein